jgi:beta-glucosidase
VDGLTVKVDVMNTGAVAGREIVQVYVHDHKSNLVRPLKELKGFAKVALQPGETKTVTVHLDSRAFAYYHPAYRQWITESGEFDILIGASSADIRCTQTVTLQSTMELPCILNRESTPREWLDDPHGKPVFEPLFKRLAPQMATLLGGEGDTGWIDMKMDIPMWSFLQDLESALPAPADEIIDGLLAQVHRGAR